MVARSRIILFLPTFLMISNLVFGASAALIQDFDSRSLGGVRVDGAGSAAPVFSDPSPYSLSGASLLVGSGAPGQTRPRLILELPTPLAPATWQRLSPNRKMTLIWKAASGAKLALALLDARGREAAVATVTATGEWQESNISLPGLGDPEGFQPVSPSAQSSLSVGSFALRLDQPGDLAVDELRWDPPAQPNDPTRVVRLLNLPLPALLAFRRADLPEEYSWILAEICRRGGATAAEIFQRRATRSWGEVAASYNIVWNDLIRDCESARVAARLVPEPATPAQLLRAASNQIKERP